MQYTLSILIVAWIIFHTTAFAVTEENFDTVLKRLQVQEDQHFEYQETRYLELLANPWNASGEMFISPDSMVIVQNSPTPLLTQISENKLLHFDRDRDIRRSINLKNPFAVPGMAPFLQLLYSSQQESNLTDYYRINFTLEQEKDLWILEMKPLLAEKNKIHTMILSGQINKGPDLLRLLYTDGDRTEWRLSLIAYGQAVSNTLQQTLDKIQEEDAFDD